MISSFCHTPVVDVFSHSIAISLLLKVESSRSQVVFVPVASLYTIAVLVGGTATDYSSELHES
jgi:hypothetical protein